ncbi:amino acid adenylation [Hydrogenovibrio crunogenus]|uniref:Amino acid adenylation n=1 Tax=Hydrogenovibrio crunogenus TaxID=39765 RepID=A0A4P7P0M6_9GAMM|nr:hypothetical protein [Hydrogenovibrio crunogenus]QBZ83701.1 amino acid adenylation [Hydrogenovibrio crunogenus]
MKILFSGSNAFCKWFGNDIERYPSFNASQVGRRSLTSGDERMCWQCQYYELGKYFGSGDRGHCVIAVEANTRMTVFIPVFSADKADFEVHFIQSLAEGVEHLLATDPKRRFDKMAFLAQLEQLDQRLEGFEWVRNTDMSVNGHVADAEQWLSQEYREAGSLIKTDLAGLQLHLNTLPKRIKISDQPKRHKKVIPDLDFIDYWARQFSEPFSEGISNTLNDIPVPEAGSPADASNVIFMKTFKQRKSLDH